MKHPSTVSIFGRNLAVRQVGVYEDGSPKIEIIDTDGVPYVTLTTYMPEFSGLLGPDEFLVKSWSENRDTVEVLAKTGQITLTGALFNNGFVTASVAVWG